MPTKPLLSPVWAATYWTMPGGIRAEAPAAPSGETFLWMDRVVAQIPCAVRHRVVVEKLQPVPASLRDWSLEPVRATARLSSDRRSVEVVFFGAVRVVFTDQDGEEHVVEKAFQARRELLIAPVPPHLDVRVLPGGSRGEGALQPSGRAPSFRGDVNLIALVHLTEPVLRKGAAGDEVAAPAPVPVRLGADTGAPSSGGNSAPQEDGFHQGVVVWLDGRPSGGAAFRGNGGDGEASHAQDGGGGLSGAGDEPGTVHVWGVVQLAAGMRPLAVETRGTSDPPKSGRGALVVTMKVRDEQGQLHEAAWTVYVPGGSGRSGFRWDVVREWWEWNDDGRSGASPARTGGSVSHGLWLRARRASPAAPPATGPESGTGAGTRADAASDPLEPAADKAELNRPTEADGPETPAAAREPGPAAEGPEGERPAADTSRDGEASEPAPQGPSAPRAPAAPKGSPASAAGAGPLVWRLPEPVAATVPPAAAYRPRPSQHTDHRSGPVADAHSSPIQRSRPGSRDGFK